ncbi:hypothetical protein EV702DRAFT_1050659 [Suillus placidus]|uniref:Uncharacterized protein n=1 Tax=Suillus placidus TaxID=48579 RepID=A0A9P6ZJF8_9AGAM|nr:hypothetical protein EV702DRAFT_1050659 [Suillus placidus]
MSVREHPHPSSKCPDKPVEIAEPPAANKTTEPPAANKIAEPPAANKKRTRDDNEAEFLPPRGHSQQMRAPQMRTMSIFVLGDNKSQHTVAPIVVPIQQDRHYACHNQLAKFPEPKHPNVIDLTGNDGQSNNLGSGTLPNSQDNDLTDEDGPPYDLGWGSRPSSPLSAPPSPGPMDLNVEDDRATSLDNLDAHAAEQLMNRINRRLKAIGNTLDNEHVHAIVKNAVHGLNDSRAPGQVLMDNRQLLGWFTDARNRVTDVGQDMRQLHRLVHLQCRMLDTVNHVIASLETDEQ